YSRYATVCTTNANYTWQKCVYCFNKLTYAKSHTIKQSKVVKNSFVCYNSVRNCCNTSSKDKLSALCSSNKLSLLSQEPLITPTLISITKQRLFL
ncbi:hypothetical protein EDC96DRAFT_446916, partial [Choanephora cucurbitarum]